ncbi:hypothetical protein EVG20_g10025 [Dentipellis fragilis]|uniref:Uncharacterized protein n=1 Tax=Dentipellis fragilis TaxID=205917 RepID=A0A4Y9XW30_9AGAM|nr:hypothetical protein EVG20_g10025 [Dentipellis fragilis]
MESPPNTAFQRSPPEIWLSIFEQATFVPHAFDTGPSDPFDVPGTPIAIDPSTQVMLQSVLPTKWSLTLVCRYWNDLATPLLYQAVVIRDDHSLQSLRDTLTKRNKRMSPAGSPTDGLRVRRLDFFQWSPSSADILVDVFQHLPDLEIYIHPHNSPKAKSCVQALIANCAPSLRKCILSPQSSLSLSEYEQFITRCPNISYIFKAYPLWEDSPMSPTLPDSLTFLSIDRPLTQSRAIPSLQHVYIWVAWSSTPQSNQIEAFFGTQGPYIRTIEFHMTSTDVWTILSLYFECCTRYCPNLVHIVLIMDYCEYGLAHAPTLSIPATVTHLGLYMGWDELASDLAVHLSVVRILFKSQNPVPGVIRRLRALTEHERKDLQEDLGLRAEFASIAARCRLEDADGNELFPYRQDLDVK